MSRQADIRVRLNRPPRATSDLGNSQETAALRARAPSRPIPALCLRSRSAACSHPILQRALSSSGEEMSFDSISASEAAMPESLINHLHRLAPFGVSFARSGKMIKGTRRSEIPDLNLDRESFTCPRHFRMSGPVSRIAGIPQYCASSSYRHRSARRRFGPSKDRVRISRSLGGPTVPSEHRHRTG
jgi:hypothetical protein